MSLPRSSRGARPAAGRTPSRAVPAQRGRGLAAQTARNDIFVVMLGVALGALLLGCLFLALKLNAYEWNLQP